MSKLSSVASQNGVITIFISMVLLLLITILVVTAYAISTTNLRAVGNVQVREEALVAAQLMIEGAIEDNDLPSDTAAMIRIDFPVDVDNDGISDFLVDREEPVCIRYKEATTVTSSSVTLPGFSSSDFWNTVWEIRVQATEANTGASVRVVQGIRLLLSDDDKNLYCT